MNLLNYNAMNLKLNSHFKLNCFYSTKVEQNINLNYIMVYIV